MGTGLRYAYVTNGLRDHSLETALALLADNGYDGVGLTLDHGHLDPFAPDANERVAAVGALLTDLGLDVVVETGARFLLDPRRKHEPTLVSDDRERRVGFLRRAVDVAAALEAPAVSLWSGAARDVAPAVAWDRLVAGLQEVLDHAERTGVDLAFEPEPGMVVDTVAAYERLAAALSDHPRFKITLDIGHCQCLEPEPPAACIERVAGRLAHVQIEDMRRGVHEHLPFGEGEIDFPPVLEALRAVGFDGLVAVELSRHSHTAHTAVPAAIDFLRGVETSVGR